ncbi:HAD family hydrolase [Candidatus Bathyarchaeota archaeon]|nr:MAG: HAD family hydrolase [Candidatus Bathyarchaeota archaeon]
MLVDRKIRAVIFDLDNTLIQSKKGARQALRVVARIFAKRLRKEGIRYSEANLFPKLRLIDLEMHGRKFLYNRDVWWETLLKQLGLSKLKGPWVHETTLRYWKTYAGASPVFYDTMSTIHRLKKAGFRLGMVSDSDGTPGMKMKRIRRQPFLKSLEAIVVAGEDTPGVKPTRRPFTLVARRLGLQPGNCVYIGDNPNTDIEGAKGVGMMMILVRRRGPKGGHPDYLVRSLSDVARLLIQN